MACETGSWTQSSLSQLLHSGALPIFPGCLWPWHFEESRPLLCNDPACGFVWCLLGISTLGMFALITGLKWHLLGCSGMNRYFSLCNSPLSFKHTHLALLCKQYILRISVHCFLERESCHTSKENSFLLFFYMCVSPIIWMYHDLLNSL